MLTTEPKSERRCIEPIPSESRPEQTSHLIDDLPQAIRPLLLKNVTVPASCRKNRRVGPENLLWLEDVGR